MAHYKRVGFDYVSQFDGTPDPQFWEPIIEPEAETPAEPTEAAPAAPTTEGE